jgi:hypothetical protein
MQEKYRYLFDLPTTTSQNELQEQVYSFIESLGFSNLLLEDSCLYDDIPMFCIHINMGQDHVVEGMPKQTSLLCDLDKNTIQVSYLAVSYIAEDDNSYLEYKDLEKHNFTWEKLKELVIKYQAELY